MDVTIIATYNTKRARDRSLRWFQPGTYLVSFDSSATELMYTKSKKTFSPNSFIIHGDQVKLEGIHDMLYALTVDMLPAEIVSVTLVLTDALPCTLNGMYTFSSGPGMSEYTIHKELWRHP